MDTKELIIFNSYQWEQGSLLNSSIDNDILYNNQNNNYRISNTKIESNDKFLDKFNISNNSFSININKENYQNIKNENFAVIETKFFDWNNIESTTDFLNINFDWNAVHQPSRDRAVIRLNTTSSSYIELTLYNRAEIEIKGFNGSNTQVERSLDTSNNSIGNIQNFLSNKMNNANIKAKIYQYGVRKFIDIIIYGSGFESKPITFNIDSNAEGFLSIEYIFPSDNDISRKDFVLNYIETEGYQDGEVYESNIFDLEEPETEIKNILVNGSINEKIDKQFDSAVLDIYIAASDKKEDIDFSNADNVTISASNDSFELDQVIDIKGRYFKYKIILRNTKSQIAFNYIKFDYILPSMITDKVYDLTEKTVSTDIGVDGGVIDFEDKIFNIKFYVPPKALQEETNITITRLPDGDDRIPTDCIGVILEPSGLSFNKKCMIEIDYTGFNLKRFQTEQGMEIIYLKSHNPASSITDYDQVHSIKDYDNKLIIGYIDHFSTYCLKAYDNDYSRRTKIEAEALPSWMSLQDKDSNFQAFQNYGLLKDVDDLNLDHSKSSRQKYIEKANIEQKHQSFKTYITDIDKDYLNMIIKPTSKIYYKGKQIDITLDQVEFYIRYDNICYFDKDKKILHFDQPYNPNFLDIKESY